jgi:hypothetical protein
MRNSRKRACNTILAPVCGAWRIVAAAATTSTPGKEHAEATLQWQSRAL